ncbi:hypothetical protein EMCRGX_G018501 [Ephydatia muelleri]
MGSEAAKSVFEFLDLAFVFYTNSFCRLDPSYEPFTTLTKVEKVCVPSGDTKKLGRQTFLHSRSIRYVGGLVSYPDPP